MTWSDEVKGMRHDAKKIEEAYNAAFRDRDYLLIAIYTVMSPFMLLGFVAGEFIGRVVVFFIWKVFELFEREE